jgi:ribosomal protein S18 acetylase RimI-like enzyme
VRSNPEELGRSGAGAEITASFRAAIKEDCYEIARLFRIASDGVADYVWSTLTLKYPGLTPLEIGARRYASEEGNFSYKNCVVAEQDGAVIGMLFTFPIEGGQEAGDGPVDSILEPYEELEILGSFYICALALFPRFRGRGLGTEMLSIAREQACERGFGTLSLLVFEQNERAVGLYEHNGFKVVDRAQVVPHNLIHHTGDVLLMASKV